MMDNDMGEGFGEIEQALSGLRDVRAPHTVYEGTLARVGVADEYFALDTTLGGVFVAFNPHGISAVTAAETAAEFEKAFRRQFGRAAVPAREPTAALRDAVEAHLRGERRELRFDLRGLSEFERAVLRKTLEIPRGEVRPYAWVAREIGRPRAVRAVGTALARNPIPLLIPCHRVVRSDGIIGNYGLGGPENKRAILQEEGAAPLELEGLGRQGVRFVGSDTTHIFCFPTCRHARRIRPDYRRLFHGEEEAVEAGFRPCKVCRPAVLAPGA